MGSFKRLDEDIDLDFDSDGDVDSPPIKADSIGDRLDRANDFSLEQGSTDFNVKEFSTPESYPQNPNQIESRQKAGTGGKNKVVIFFALTVVLAAVAAIVFFIIQGKDKTGMLQAQETGSVVFKSDLKDLKVSISGKDTDVEDRDGALSLTLPEGKYDIEFSKEGYKSETFSADVRKNQTVDLGAINLESSISGNTLSFTLNVDGAEIFIDGKPVVPSEIQGNKYVFSNIESGKHEISIKKLNFKTLSSDFEVAESYGKDMGNIELASLPWRVIEIEVMPVLSQVFINDNEVQCERKGSVLMTDYLEPGVVKVELRAKGYKPWINESFEIFSDITNSIGPIYLAPEEKSSEFGKTSEKNSGAKGVDSKSSDSKEADDYSFDTVADDSKEFNIKDK